MGEGQLELWIVWSGKFSPQSANMSKGCRRLGSQLYSYRVNSMPGRGNSRCKGPDVGKPGLIKIVGASMAGAEWAKTVQWGEVREGRRWPDHVGFSAPLRSLDFTLEGVGKLLEFRAELWCDLIFTWLCSLWLYWEKTEGGKGKKVGEKLERNGGDKTVAWTKGGSGGTWTPAGGLWKRLWFSN